MSLGLSSSNSGDPCCLTSRGTNGVASGTAAAGLPEPPRHPDIENASAAVATNAIRFERRRIIDATVLRLLVQARPGRRETDSPPADNSRAQRSCAAVQARA